MYYDLIYTRCRHGIDILRSGQPILNDGFKIYTCSSELYKRNLIDLRLALNFVQRRQSFSEPDFMDDAYLYAVPDIGFKLLDSFHPVPFDLSVIGNFSKTHGMYLNHAVAGDFEDIYPFETFHDKRIWTAQENNEAYYYEHEPQDLCPRDIALEGNKSYSFSDIGEFIKNGRQELLKQAVAFLIKQFRLPMKERKYLVIKDESSENIEMWIAAVELAFSPKMASNISFATRLDKFASTNTYYVNSDGTFSQQQNTGGGHARLRAMIVGVITKDKANSARMISDAPYVLIDGEKKEALFDIAIVGRYYNLICSFDDVHERFSREFLQSFDLNQPCEALVKLADAYETLCETSPNSPNEYAVALRNIASFKCYKTDIICAIYKRVNERLGQFLKSSTEKSLPILNWVGDMADFMSDGGAKQRISEIITKRATEVFFTDYKKNTIIGFWEDIKNGSFVSNISELLHDKKTINEYLTVIRKYDTKDVTVFFDIYCTLCKDSLLARNENAKMIISCCVSACSKHRNSDSLCSILSTLECVLQNDSYIFILESIKTYEPETLNDVVNYIVKNMRARKGNLDAILSLCKALHGYEMDKQTMNIIERYINDSKDIMDLNMLARKVGKAGYLNELIKRKIYEIMDKKVNVANSDFDILAFSIQENKPDSAECINSAHISVLNVLGNNDGKITVRECLTPYVKQGFPVIAIESYISRLVSVLLKLNLSASDQEYVLEMIAGASDSYGKQYMAALITEAENNQSKWESTVSFACTFQDTMLKRKMDDALHSSLIGSGMKKKNMEALGKLLSDKTVKRYYESVVEDISNMMKERDGSMISRLFRGFRK